MAEAATVDIASARHKFRHFLKRLQEFAKFLNDSQLFVTIFSTCVQLFHIRAAAEGERNCTVKNFPLRTRERTQIHGCNLLCLSVVKCVGETPEGILPLKGKHFLRCLVNREYLAEDLKGACDDGSETSWLYPLLEGVTTCYLTSYGAFILPDLNSDRDDEAFGVLIESDDAREFLSLLKDILNPAADMIALQNQEHITAAEDDEEEQQQQALDAIQRDPRNVQMEQKYNTAANMIVDGITWAGEKVTQLISWSTPRIEARLREHREQGEVVTEPTVPEGVSSCLKKAKTVAEKSSSIAERTSLGYNKVLGHVGGYLAPQVNHLGVKAFEGVLGNDRETAKRNMDTLSTTALGLHHVFSSATEALRDSAALVGNEFGQSSLKLIETNYGPSVGAAAHDAFDTLRGAVNTAQTLKDLKPRNLPKKVVKNTVLRIGETSRPLNDLYPKLRTLNEDVLLEYLKKVYFQMR